MFHKQTLTAAGPRETPVLFTATDFDEERRRLYEVARERVVMGENVAILLPQRRQPFGFRKAMQEFGLDTEVQDRHESLDFTNLKPKLLTYHSAKGLTFDSVLLPRVVQSSFERPSESQALRMMFVAITRAARWVFLSTVAGKKPSFLSRLKPLAASGELAARGGQPVTESQPSSTVESPDSLDDLFFS